MARPLSTAVAVSDLVHITEYLVRLAYAPLRSTLSAGDGASIRVERETVLKTALMVEELSEEWERDRRKDVDRCRLILQSVIQKTLSPDAIRRMRTSVRRMRMETPPDDDFSLVAQYNLWSSDDDQAVMDI